MQVTEFIRRKTIKYFIAKYSGESCFGDHSGRMTMKQLFAEYCKDGKQLDFEKFSQNISRYLSSLVSPTNHQVISFAGILKSLYDLICEFIKFENENEQENFNFDTPLRLIEYFDGSSDAWRTDWTTFDLNTLSLYDVCYDKGIFDFDALSKEHGVLYVQEHDEHCIMLATSEIEAKLLFLIYKADADTMINGMRSIENAINDYSYLFSWNSIDVNRISACNPNNVDDEFIQSVKDDSCFKDLTLSGCKDRITWCLKHLGIYMQNSSVVNPISLWVIKGRYEDSWIVKEAFDWFEYISSNSDSVDITSYFNFSEASFKEYGIYPYNEIITAKGDITFWDYDKELYVFPFSSKNLIKRHIIKFYRMGNLCVHALSVDDAKKKIITYLICTMYNTHEKIDSNYSFSSFFKKKSECFLDNVNQKIEEYNGWDSQDCVCIDPDYDSVFSSLLRPIFGIRESGYFDGSINILHHGFSFIAKKQCYILLYNGNYITEVRPGYNAFDAQGDNSDEREYPVTLSPYSPSYRIDFAFNFDSMAYYLLY